MKEEWELVILNEVAEQEILELTADLQSKFLRITELLIKLGPSNVSMPHIKHIEDKLWEIRLNGKVNIARSIYFLAHKKKIVILHTFIKKTQKTPKKALQVAKQRMKEINYEVLRKKLLSNPDVLKEYEASTLEYEVAHALILARVQANMTQEEVAKKMNTTQSVIARLESGKHFPSLLTIYRYAIAVDKPIDLHVQP